MSDASVPAIRLLIVDDDAGLGKTLSGILRKAGYEAHWASTGTEALRLLRETQPAFDVALLDVGLPDINGLELLKALKKDYPDVGAIMMTGHADMETALGALHQGAFAYIQKPYQIDEVKATINRLVEKQQLTRENQRLLKKMMELNAELENKVRERTADLQTTNMHLAETIEGLRRADAIKSEFVAMVSHELRTPLTVIMGCTQTLLHRMDQIDKQSLEKYLRLIANDAQRLTRVGQEILELSEIQKSGVALRYEPFDLQQLIEHLLEGYRANHDKKRFTCAAAQPDCTLISDKNRIEQVLTNLLNNAAKYTPDGEAVEVRLEFQKEQIQVSVIDAGPGILPEERLKVFDPFYRTQDAINFKNPGTGLGLTITKAIVQALGGRIWIEKSPANKGSNFLFTVPQGMPLQPDDSGPLLSEPAPVKSNP